MQNLVRNEEAEGSNPFSSTKITHSVLIFPIQPAVLLQESAH